MYAAKQGNAQSRLPARVDQAARDDKTRALILGGENSYSVAGKEVASASAINVAFTNHKAPTGSEILDCGKDEHRAWARVAVWMGPKANPVKVAEDSVIIYFDDLREKILWEWLDRKRKERNCDVSKLVRIDEATGRPVPTNPGDMIDLAKLFFRTRYFAERTAITQARARAQKQLLGYDWQDEDERAEEYGEREIFAPPPRPKAQPRQRREPAPSAPSAPSAPPPPPPPPPLPGPNLALVQEIERLVSDMPVPFDNYMLAIEEQENERFNGMAPLPARPFDRLSEILNDHKKKEKISIDMRKKVEPLVGSEAEAWEVTDHMLRKFGLFEPSCPRSEIDAIAAAIAEIPEKDIKEAIALLAEQQS